MKKVSLLLSLFTIIQAYSQNPDTENTFTFGAYNDFYSKYVWRGYVNYDIPVYQPGIYISYKNVSLNLSANINIDEEEDVSNFNEADAILSYDISHKNFNIQPGFQYFYYPQDKYSSTGELFLNLQYSFNVLGIYTSNNIDIINYKGAFYNETGLYFSNDFSDKFNYTITTGIGFSNSKFNEIYAGLQKSMIDSYFLNQSLSYYPANNISITPKINLNMTADKDLKKINGENSIIYFGLSLAFEY